MNREEDHTTFIIRVIAKPGAAGIHQIRAVLKALLRRLGLKAVEVKEDRESES